MTSQTAALTPAHAPAVGVEQAEQRALARDGRPGAELLGHAARAHEAVRVPVMLGWTEHTKL